MKEDIKTKWVTRLRELDEQGNMQAQGVLKDGNGKMCCLGVLTELAVDEGVIEPGTLKRQRTVYADDTLNGVNGWFAVTPPIVAEWAGFERYSDEPGDFEVNPKVVFEGYHTTLATLNDDGRNFAEIADAIEANL